MVRRYAKKKPPPGYSIQDVLDAVMDVRNRNKTYKEAAEFYHVPVSVIADRVTGKVKSEGNY